MKLILPLFILSQLISGCGKQSLAPGEYMKWVEDESNGLKVKRTLSDVIFTLQYRPVDYMMAQEFKADHISPQQLAQRRQELETALHFNLTLSADNETQPLKNNTGPDGYFERVNHFLTDGANDFKLRCGNDTFDCSLCHLEQTYGLAPVNTLVLAFEPRSTMPVSFTHDLVLIYEDKVLGTGTVKMKIEKEKLEQMPMMKR